MSSLPDEKETAKKKGEEEAKALEQAYRETHPSGPFPPVDTAKRKEVLAQGT